MTSHHRHPELLLPGHLVGKEFEGEQPHHTHDRCTGGKCCGRPAWTRPGRGPRTSMQGHSASWGREQGAPPCGRFPQIHAGQRSDRPGLSPHSEVGFREGFGVRNLGAVQNPPHCAILHDQPFLNPAAALPASRPQCGPSPSCGNDLNFSAQSCPVQCQPDPSLGKWSGHAVLGPRLS